MTYEEAIKNINALNAVCGQKGLYEAEFESALELAIYALEKQIPKKPIFEREQTSLFGVDDVPYCPNCKCSIPEVSYCEECGQAIDWEVSEDV